SICGVCASRAPPCPPSPVARRPSPGPGPYGCAARDPGGGRASRRPGRRPAHRRYSGGSRPHGVAVFELRLPPPTVVTLIVRGGVTLFPDRDTVLRSGDALLLITTPLTREATERRLRAIGRSGKPARRHGEHGSPSVFDG